MRTANSIGRWAAIISATATLMLALAAGARAQQTPSPHSFLVATPDLGDPMFQHSVIMMLPVKDTPLVAGQRLVAGLIVNKPTTIPVKKMFPQSQALKNGAEMAYLGGPVDLTEPSLAIRGAAPGGDAKPLFDDVYVSLDRDSIAQLLKSSLSSGNVRVFFGRSQWSTDQLQAEMFEGSWYVVPADAAVVFSTDPKQVWKTLVSQAKLQEVEEKCGQMPGPFASLACPGSPAHLPSGILKSAFAAR
jgi:putative transcriptional regulator